MACGRSLLCGLHPQVISITFVSFFVVWNALLFFTEITEKLVTASGGDRQKSCPRNNKQNKTNKQTNKNQQKQRTTEQANNNNKTQTNKNKHPRPSPKKTKTVLSCGTNPALNLSTTNRNKAPAVLSWRRAHNGVLKQARSQTQLNCCNLYSIRYSLEAASLSIWLSMICIELCASVYQTMCFSVRLQQITKWLDYFLFS